MNQLAEVTSNLEQRGITYWVDSGTLLGLVRDDELLDSDPDLDFGVWAKEFADIDLTDALSGRYKVQDRLYNGDKYKVKYIPKNKDDGSRTIDINLFRRNKDIAWCPAGMIENTYNSQSIYYSIFEEFKDIIKYFNRNSDMTIKLDSYPTKYFATIGFWEIPIKYYQNLTSLEKHDYPAPSPVNEYLQFRYGKWKQEVTDWSYWEDDGGLNHSSPTEMELTK